MSKILRLPLHPHPASPGPQGLTISMMVSVEAHVVTCEYALSGPVEAMSWPPPAPHERMDELWRTTCCEVFFCTPDTPDYLEYNFSPSGRWAAYRFDSFRAGGRDAEVAPPTIALQRAAGAATLRASVSLKDITPYTHACFTAVLETSTAEVFYWAAAHAYDKPEFHALAGKAALPL